MARKNDLSLALTCIAIVAILCTAPIFALVDNGPVRMHGTVTGYDTYGNLSISLTTFDFERNGYQYGDQLSIEYEGKRLSAAYIDRFNGGTPYEVCLSSQYNQVDVCLLVFSSLSSHNLGLEPGDEITISYEGRSHNSERFSHVFAGTQAERRQGQSDGDYANFRCVRFNDHFSIYRSGSPFFIPSGEDRMVATDRMMEKSGVGFLMNLSSDAKAIEEIIESAREKGICKYSIGLFDSGGFESFHCEVDSIVRASDLAPIFLAILEHSDENICLTCQLGKDRTGLMMMILEALAGFQLKDVAADYCQTFVNLYGIEPGSDEYNDVMRVYFGRTLYLLANPDLAPRAAFIDWDKVDVPHIDIRSAAKSFLLNKVGLSSEELLQLEALVTK